MMRVSWFLVPLLASTLVGPALAQGQADPSGHGSTPVPAGRPAPGAASPAEDGPQAAESEPELPRDPPKGPADIMNRAAAGRAQGDLERASRTGEAVAQRVAQGSDAGTQAASGESAAAAGTEPTPGEQAPAAGDPHQHGRDPHAVLAEPELPRAEPQADLPAGTIAVQVIDADGSPAAGADIVLGVMASMGARTEQSATSDAQGRHVFRDLGVGSQQAYRVNVLRDGAKFSSTPFRLPEDRGYAVRVPLRATTTDTNLLFQVIGQSVVELRDDRLHLTQQARLANAGEQTIVLPPDGLLVPLPEGFTAFQWQEQMTDQKGEELKDKGFRIRGSLPPGTVTLAWTFDLPRAGASAEIPITQPWRTYTYRVISEAPEGLELSVNGFPAPERIKDEQRHLLFTQVQRRPSEPQLGAFTIRLDGIPSPGPGRWIAVALATLAVLAGLLLAVKPGDDAAERKAALAARKRELIELAKGCEREHAKGEIGPQFHAERSNEIVTELALVLRDEQLLTSAKK